MSKTSKLSPFPSSFLCINVLDVLLTPNLMTSCFHSLLAFPSKMSYSILLHLAQ